jgi:Nif-specific regulatory protein
MDIINDRQSGLLEKIGRVFIENSGDINLLMSNVFNLIVAYYNIERGMISIYHKEEDEIFVDIHHGYSEEEVTRGIYKPGEGIIGTVVKTGNPYIVMDIMNEPKFLNRTGANRNTSANKISFICVPVKLDSSVIGTISVDIINNYGRDLAEEYHALTTVSIMIAQAVNSRIESIARERKLKEENELLRKKISMSTVQGRIIGKSSVMKEVYKKILMVSGSDVTVLITGESGTGKELIADAIHQNSKRSAGPFVKVNVAALPKSLIESELFGYEKGAFTGADKMKKGRFELAHGGTIFLDEIGDLDISLQVHLLRVIQEKSIERVGGSDTIPVDVRIIAATHQNLEEKIKKNEFREDLYYRLNVFPLHSPKLRDRKSDIVLLADYFLETYSAKAEKTINRLSTDAIDLLVAYHWPGNVRELENCMERAVILCSEDVIRNYHLPPSLQKFEEKNGSGTLEERTDLFEKELIIDALKISNGNISNAANKLGTTKRILGYKIDKLGIDYKSFRVSEK